MKKTVCHWHTYWLNICKRLEIYLVREQRKHFENSTAINCYCIFNFNCIFINYYAKESAHISFYVIFNITRNTRYVAKNVTARDISDEVKSRCFLPCYSKQMPGKLAWTGGLNAEKGRSRLAYFSRLHRRREAVSRSNRLTVAFDTPHIRANNVLHTKEKSKKKEAKCRCSRRYWRLRYIYRHNLQRCLMFPVGNDAGVSTYSGFYRLSIASRVTLFSINIFFNFRISLDVTANVFSIVIEGANSFYGIR